jgi:hypothetical protein
MKARPILFSGPMVRALLAGTKTQTRRVVKPQPQPMSPDLERDLPEAWASGFVDVRCPYGIPGDLLWVRECIQVLAYDAARPASADIIYLADEDGDWRTIDWPGPHHVRQENGYTVGRLTPSIHMPRAASRLTLEITDVRVERLQDISEEDAKAEGITEHPCNGPHRGPDATYWTADGPEPDAPLKRTTPVGAYKALWGEINGEESWLANPWCWAVSFRVHQQNVDAFLNQRAA